MHCPLDGERCIRPANQAAPLRRAPEQYDRPLLCCLTARRIKAAPLALLAHPGDVWKVEFNRMGMMLAASLADSPAVWFWMPELTGQWRAVSRVVGGDEGGMDVE